VLTPQEADGLFGVLRRLAGQGLGVIFISHKLGEVLAVSHRIVVLRGGRKAGELETATANRRAIAELMVGREVAPSRREALDPGPPVLQLTGVDVAGKDDRRSLHGVTLAVHAREIVGIAGVSGNGQAALAGLIAGLIPPDGGEMHLDGQPVRHHDPRAFVARGVARVPEDRHHDGIVGAMTIAENVAIEDIREPGFQRAGFLDFRAIRARAEAAIRDYDVRCPGPEAPARLLSGGNIQKLILARVLERNPRLILANQPSRGLDVGAMAEVHRRLLAARERGAGVVLISEDLDELFALSDRVLVIHAGRIAEAGRPETLDRGTVGLMMAGHHGEDAA
jgi:simple sugar transport system ATP-binding protein